MPDLSIKASPDSPQCSCFLGTRIAEPEIDPKSVQLFTTSMTDQHKLGESDDRLGLLSTERLAGPSDKATCLLYNLAMISPLGSSSR